MATYQSNIAATTIISHRIQSDAELMQAAQMTLSALELSKVRKYSSIKQQEHCTMSILLQRHLIRSSFDVADFEYDILRSAENKPYLKLLGKRPKGMELWNYNTSHHGQFVVVACSITHLIGVDVVELTVRESWRSDARTYVNMFKDQFSPLERAKMLRQTTDKKIYRFGFSLHVINE